ncbi:hypothetical protein N865_18130 [Intrasporangium oryzae NRRL B-24470]|uniref:DUF3806 domain-containing protein n=1 Tax=Intrasporangium oryzae NRRL B-24470 TaxID=1386089 RepID=W9G200_9MICO|nr:DUF3806 domain-containing protein [Intrasporangium oryzae]EWT00121.1 hypothetical protein N865_18130 [Intrasporangium oryzae NRRL B-24470]
MGLFSRKSKDQPAPAPGPDVDAPDWEGDEDDVTEMHTGRPESRPLTEYERSRVLASLEKAAEEGIDIDDLASIGAAYDAAYTRWTANPDAEGPDAVVDLYAVAIGEHLARHSYREWGVVTDVFGTDLGLVDARADTVIVPHNLVGARWMRGELGWIPGVVGHLVGLRPRAS